MKRTLMKRTLVKRTVMKHTVSLRRTIFWAFLLFAALPLTVRAEKIHLIIAADANESDAVGRTVAADGDNIRDLFSAQVPRHQLNIRKLPYEQVGRQGIFRAIEELSVDRTDCIVVYFSGHGAYDARRGQYLALSRDQPLLRSEVLDKMRSRGNRLNVLITDCCNTRSDIRDKSGTGPVAMGGGPREIAPLFQKLFFEASGTIDMTAAEKDSWGFIYPPERMFTEIDGKRRMKASIFTWIFCIVCTREKQSRKTWDEIFQAVRTETNQDFQQVFPNGYTSRGRTQRSLIPFAKLSVRYGSDSSVDTPPPVDPPAGEQQRPLRFGVRAANRPEGDGVLITEVFEGSPGKAAKLRVGDVIIEINGRKIHNEDDYRRAIIDSPREMNFVIVDTVGEEFEGTAFLNETR